AAAGRNGHVHYRPRQLYRLGHPQRHPGGRRGRGASDRGTNRRGDGADRTADAPAAGAAGPAAGLGIRRSGGVIAARGSTIVGLGRAVPNKVLTNADLARMVDTTEEWIISRTRIRARRIAPRGLL